MAELARAVVDGERVLLPDGSPIVNIKGHWYNADRENVGTFMRESKGPEEAVSPTNQEDERVRRVERLEALLLEGKISEATYKDLKRKYESRP